MAIETIDLIGCDCCGTNVFCCCLRKVVVDLPTISAEIDVDPVDCVAEANQYWTLENRSGYASAGCLWNIIKTTGPPDCGGSFLNHGLDVSTNPDAGTGGCYLYAIWEPSKSIPATKYHFRKDFAADDFCGGVQTLPYIGRTIGTGSLVPSAPAPWSATAVIADFT